MLYEAHGISRFIVVCGYTDLRKGISWFDDKELGLFLNLVEYSIMTENNAGQYKEEK